MQGKVCVVTGATSGIGLVAAERLGAMGARLVLVGRDRARGEAALARLKERVPGVTARMHYGDLSRLAEMNRVASDIAAAEPRIDVLINNAGALFQERGVTDDGLERTFALNHMAYFVLSNRLKNQLAAAAPARIVSVASDAHRGNIIDFTDLQAEHHYRGFTVYGRSKLANILFTRELARRLSGTGITANCLHPGFVASRFGDNNGGLFRLGLGLAKRFAISPEKGAETIVYLASSPEVATVSGGYFAKCRPAKPTTAGQDDTAARRLWEESARIAKMPA
jgi:NAD(P)-dependent dehydrogenase (short-subunit alcohol dehydrogenase family)